eukprot:TRINITY_DN2481_c0_g1_i6.p1 TRINITY_DN2481_c0_g1~~TRINITY_DN2481_c0_g1_i6.p1  ORF type:complete len:146 (+),score=16.80 TRINITY_DN2481_c0_g1_i6:185-622(+)
MCSLFPSTSATRSQFECHMSSHPASLHDPWLGSPRRRPRRLSLLPEQIVELWQILLQDLPLLPPSAHVHLDAAWDGCAFIERCSHGLLIPNLLIPPDTHSAAQLPRRMSPCLLYTSDAADEEDSVDLGGRRIIKKKKKKIELSCI